MKGNPVSSDTSDARPPHSDSGTDSHSESENPAIDSPKPKSHAPLTNKDWWPEQVDVSMLHRQNEKGNPLGQDFDYAEAFAQLDVGAFIKGTRLIRFMKRMYTKSVPIKGVKRLPVGPRIPHTNESNPPASISKAD